MKKEIEIEIKSLIHKLKNNNKKLSDITSESEELSGCDILTEIFSDSDDLLSSDSYNINPVFKSLRGSYLSYRDDDGYSDSIDVLIGESGKGDLFYTFDLDESDAWFVALQKDSLKYISRKHPSIFKSMMIKRYDLIPPEEAKQTYDSVIDISSIIKGKKKSEVLDFIVNEDLKKKVFLEFVKSKGIQSSVHDLILGLNAEELYDLSQHLTEEQKTYTFVNKVTSKKSKDLFTKKSYNYIKELIRIGVSEKEFKLSFSNKISKYKNEDDLELGLQKYLQALSGWSKDAWSKRLESYDILYNEIYDDVIMFEVEDFKTMSKIGSSQWCIATDEGFFDQYVNKKTYNRQMMILDFNIESDDPLSMVGVTIDTFGNHLNAHDKNDTDMISGFRRNDVLMEKIREKTLPYDDVKLKEKVLHDALSDSDFLNDNEVNIKVFKYLSNYGLVNNKEFKEAELGVQNYLVELNQKDFDINKKTKCIENLMVTTSESKNNISELFNCILKTNIPVSDLIDFNNFRPSSLIKKERSDTFLKIFIDKYSDKCWDFFADTLTGDNFSVNFKIVKNLYEKNKKNFWKDFNLNSEYTELLSPLFFESKEMFDFFKDKDIPVDILLSTLNLSSVINEPNIIENSIKHFKNKSEEEKKQIINELSKNMSFNTLLLLQDNGALDKNEYLHSIKLALDMNKDKSDNYSLYELNGRNKNHVLYKPTIEFIIDNTENINDIFNCEKLTKDDDMRRLFLDKNVMDKKIYTFGYFLDGNLEKKGFPLVMEAIEEIIQTNSNPNINIEIRVKKLYDDILESAWINKTELKKMLVEKIPSLSKNTINNLSKDKKSLKLQF
jgi:hypothetical protein